MRVIAAVVVVALLLPAAAATTLRGADACCCATGPGATCPMKRSAAKCEPSEVRTCGITRSDAPATPLPLFGFHRPALLAGTATAGIHVVVVPFDPPPFHFATRARHAPEAPPPRFV